MSLAYFSIFLWVFGVMGGMDSYSLMENARVQKKSYGFTLWEVLLVLCLLAAVACLVTPAFSASVGHTRAEANQANIMQIEKAVSLYYLDTGLYPASITALVANEESADGWRGPYLEAIPSYPYDQHLQYGINSRGKVILK